MDSNTYGSEHTSYPAAQLENEVTQELSSLLPLSSMCRIYKVPKRLLVGNERSYIPTVVSLGPFHHGKEELQGMEEHKKRFLEYFLRISNVSLRFHINFLLQKEGELRACYAEAIPFSSNEFLKIVLVDAAFIIVFLLKLEFQLEDEDDRVFGRPWMMKDTWLDMLLIENQLPFFILKDLLNHGITFTYRTGCEVEIFGLCCNFFRKLMRLEVNERKLAELRSFSPEHFVDLLRQLYLPLRGEGEQQRRGKLQLRSIPSISELHQVGVTFKVGSSENLFDLQFRNGILEIPILTIGEETEIPIRNLLAFEQCHYKDSCVNEYVFILNRLINTQKDVDLMVKCGIVENKLVNNEQGSYFVNKLIDGVAVNFEEFYFASVCEGLNKYNKKWYRRSWHNWMADLRYKYLNTPWTIISLLVAATLLILAFIQTLSSAKSSNAGGQKP